MSKLHETVFNSNLNNPNQTNNSKHALGDGANEVVLKEDSLRVIHAPVAW